MRYNQFNIRIAIKEVIPDKVHKCHGGIHEETHQRCGHVNVDVQRSLRWPVRVHEDNCFLLIKACINWVKNRRAEIKTPRIGWHGEAQRIMV